MYNLAELDKNSEEVLYYIETNKEKTPQFMERYNGYDLEKEIETKIKCHNDNFSIYAFSAEWCPDCYKHIPVLAHISEKTGLKIRIFGHLMRDAKNPNRRWKIPPSAKEVELFNVIKIPSIYIIDNDGKKVGEIIEHPPVGKTLEAAVLDIFES